MPIEPADLPVRKLDADRCFDAVAYCPVCRTTEVQIVKTYTSHWNMIAGSDRDGFRVSVIHPIQNLADSRQYNMAGPWQFTIYLKCGNEHEFRIAFFTDKGLTWAEVGCDGHQRISLPIQSGQSPSSDQQA